MPITNIFLFYQHFLSTCLKYSDPEYEVFSRAISVISVVLRETTLIISDSIETGAPVESEIVRVVSLSSTNRNNSDNTFKKKKKNRYSWSEYIKDRLV